MLLAVRIWIWISAFATLAGWTLSAFGQLNRAGYGIFFVVVIAITALLRKKFEFNCNRGDDRNFPLPARRGEGQGEGILEKCSTSPRPSPPLRGGEGEKTFLSRKFLRRFRRALPLCFGALAILIFISGVIHAPDNYTGLTYRTGRVLQWLAHGHWFWIHTSDYRMNDRACGIEWLSAPILLFTNSTRALFLLNFIPFLLLPGLIFSVFTRLGVRPRVAWQWMWLLPTGYIFLLQAGSIANDAFPTVYALAAMDFALRAFSKTKMENGRWKIENKPRTILHPQSSTFIFYSVLAAALLTGAKASNLPLLLPWAVLMTTKIENGKWRIEISNARAIFHPLSSILVIAVSFLPTAILNAHYCGDWSGGKLEPAAMTVKNPMVAIGGNTFQLLLQNFAPPFFSFANWWNQHAPQILPQTLDVVSKNFDTGFFQLGELPTEDWAGLGFGLSALLTISIAANFLVGRAVLCPLRRARSDAPYLINCKFFQMILFAPWLALLFYCAKSGMTTAARLIAPYYPLLLPLLLIGAAQSQIVRRRWWRVLVCGNLILAFAVLILTPDRPLWPAQTILSKAAAQHPNSHSLSRALNVYSVYARRADPLADVRKLLPPDVKIVGFIGDADDCDISLWLPISSRRVEHFLLSDPPEKIREGKIEYVVIGGYNLKSQNISLGDWLQKSGAELVAGTNATLKVSQGPQPWFVARLKP